MGRSGAWNTPRQRGLLRDATIDEAVRHGSVSQPKNATGLTDEDALVVGECMYRESPLEHSALASLETHVEELRWEPSGGGTRTVQCALFSRRGLTDSIREAAAERDDFGLYTIGDVIAALGERTTEARQKAGWRRITDLAAQRACPPTPSLRARSAR
ncbi:hypothetical protein [Halorubrum sp. SP9]|uniref:hypothetical protein n=1 Tax=Halorubrum sp. SP9 TaxID=1537267 RepID=UPI001F5466A9|nr:hypothetical protein [Halorubrum sp. SP9]